MWHEKCFSCTHRKKIIMMIAFAVENNNELNTRCNNVSTNLWECEEKWMTVTEDASHCSLLAPHRTQDYRRQPSLVLLLPHWVRVFPNAKSNLTNVSTTCLFRSVWIYMSIYTHTHTHLEFVTAAVTKKRNVKLLVKIIVMDSPRMFSQEDGAEWMLLKKRWYLPECNSVNTYP